MTYSTLGTGEKKRTHYKHYILGILKSAFDFGNSCCLEKQFNLTAWSAVISCWNWAAVTQEVLCLIIMFLLCMSVMIVFASLATSNLAKNDNYKQKIDMFDTQTIYLTKYCIYSNCVMVTLYCIMIWTHNEDMECNDCARAVTISSLRLSWLLYSNRNALMK